MSKTIDERVVEMRFDNAHFEKHTRESMSTLDKLKQKLNLTGASKGLENINASANKVNMNGLSKAVETVHSRFSALEVMGVTALANITNSAVNAGKRIISALTIEPVSDGWKEYEMTLNAVQTTMAGTGKSVEEVEKELKKLDEYADKTVYSTADMLNNLPKFTNAGVDLEKATKAMIGIANATALAGGDAGKASIAFYNLGQAIGTGYLTRMDYNSINNAGIATMEWKNQMVDAALAAGTLTKAGDGLYKSGNKTYTLQQLFIDGLQTQWATTDVMMKVFGDYGDETTEIGKKSYAAAQDIKTFTMMMESLKATAGTGWKDTWQIIFGGLDDAKKFWTGINNFISNIITKMADFRNNLLEGALSFNPWQSLMDKLENSGIGKIKDKINAIGELTDKIKYFRDIVAKVWKGDYNNRGDNPDRFNLLKKAGYDPRVVQHLVNKGYNYRDKITEEDIAEAYKAVGIEMEKTSESANNLNTSFENLTDKQLKNIGFTEEEIKLFRELEHEAKRLGIPIEDLLKKMEKADGRTLLIDGLKNAASGLVGVFKALKDAWIDIFPPITSVRLYTLIDSFNEFSKRLRLTEEGSGELNEKGKQLLRTFKGLFAALDIALTVIAGPIKIALKLLMQFLDVLDIDLLEFTANVGDVIVGMRDWLDSVLDFTPVFEYLLPYIKKGAAAVKEWFKNLKDNKALGKFTDYLEKAKDSIIDWFSGLKDIKKSDIINFFKSLGESIKNIFSNINKHFNGVPGDILSGLINGLKNGIVQVKEAIIKLATALVGKFKEILGIESPSKVFFAIGGFIIAGLIGGLLAGSGKIGETIGGIADNIAGFFGNIDWSKIFSAGMSAGLLLLAKRLVDIVDNISAPLGGLGDLFSGAGEVMEKSAVGIGRIIKQTAKVVKSFSKVVKSFSKILSGIAFEHQTEGIKNLAVSLLILVGAITILTFLDIKKMWNAVGVIAALATILGILSWAMTKISQESLSIDIKGKAIKTKGMNTAILSIGIALLALGITMKIIGKMEPGQIIAGLLGLLGIIGALILVIAALGTFIKGKTAQNMDKIGKAMRKMAMTLLLMVAVVKLVSLLEWTEMGKGAAFIAGFLVFVAGLAAIGMIPGKGIKKIGGTLLAISAAMLLMVVVIKLVSGLDEDELKRGIAFAAGFLIFVAGLAAIGMIPGNGIAKVGGTLIGIAGAMLIMSLIVKLLSSMNFGAMMQGVFGVTLLGIIIAGLMYMIKLVGPDAPKLATTLLAMSIAIGIMAAVAIVLSLIDVAGLAKGIIAVGMLAGLMSLMILATKNAQEVKGSIIAMAVAIGVMAAAVALLSFIDWQKLLPATIALGALMGMFALIENQSKHVTGSWACLLVMTAAIAVLTGALYLIAQLPAEQALTAAGALSLLMLAMSGVMFILSKINNTISGAIQGAIGLLALCVPLVAMAGILILMKNTTNAIESAKSLSLLLGVMTGALVVLSLIGTALAPGALVGAIALLALCVPLVAIAGILILMNNIEDAMGNAKALSLLLLTMASVLTILAVVGPLALIGVSAIGALTLVIIAIGALVIAIGALMEKFPSLQSFLDTGISALIQLADGIGRMIGAFVSGALSQIAISLPGIGTNLSLFMLNATPFIAGAKMVDETVLKGVGILAAAILALTAADLIAGITSFLQGGSSFATLGTELSMFIMNAMPFIILSKQIDPNIMTGIKTLAEAVLILTGANILEGLTAWATGGNSLANFGSQLGSLGTCLNTFVTNLGTFTEAQVTTVNCAGQAVKSLAQAASAIPNEGGLWAKIAGENSLATFGGYLPDLGTNLGTFVRNLGTFTEAQVTTTDCAGRAIKALADSASQIPNTGGLWAAICGDNSLATFGSYLPDLGTNLSSFITNLGTFDDKKVSTVDCAGRAVKALADAANTIPNEGGLWAKIFGDNSLSTFAGHLPGLATKLKEFVKELGEFSSGQISTVNAACDAIRSIATLGEIDIKDTGSKLEKFGGNMVKFAKKVKEFVEKISGASGESITSAIDKTKQLIEMSKTIADVNIESIKTFGDSLKKFAKEGVNGFVNEFSGDSPKSKAKKAVKEMIQAGIDGADDKKSTIEKKFKEIAKAAVDELNTSSIKSDAKKAGKNVAKGFANGIKENKYLAANAGSSLGKEALKAAKAALKEQSPSRAFYDVGDYAVQGFTNALYDGNKLVYDSGYSMAELAKNGLSKAISKVSALMDSGIDTQPTIRPVLDLSDVESGAGYLNSMFNNGPSVGVSANLRAISSGMNAKIQNGLNNIDVISAINKLRKDLGNIGGDTYNINGVTYDDGSNISDAVKSIIRAARVERRS